MPSPRRVRLLVYLVLAGVVTFLFFTSRARHGRDPDALSLGDFYRKTADAMGRRQGAGTGGAADGDGDGQKVMAGHDADGDGDIDEDDETFTREMAERLRQAEKEAKDSANAKAPNKPDNPADVIGVGNSASGQHRGSSRGGPDAEESDEEHEVEMELNAILKKSPVIIFSKSYCPYSKRAKGVLLEKYVIEPPPYVVELDQHPLGPQIQARLGEMTGRKTVPNVMIYGKSIGGGDEIAELDRIKGLAGKIKSLAGERVKVSERFVESTQKAG